MNVKECLRQLSVWEGMPAQSLEAWLNAAQVTRCSEGQILSRQYQSAECFYLLVSGAVALFTSPQDAADGRPAAIIDQAWTPLGWSGLTSPHRYALTTRCAEPCTLIRWSRQSLQSLLQAEPRWGRRMLRYCLEAGADFLRQARSAFGRSRSLFHNAPLGCLSSGMAHCRPAAPDVLEILQCSVSFEIFPEQYLRRLSLLGESRAYVQGECIFSQGQRADGIYLLARGKVALWFAPEPHGKPHAGQCFAGTFARLGQVVDWAAALSPQRHDVTAVAVKDTVLHLISWSSIERFADECEAFGMELMRRFLSVVIDHLRVTRMQLSPDSRGDREIGAIRSLLEQTGAQLRLTSPLYRIPYLLGNRLTLEDAFGHLENLLEEGSALEKRLARQCLNALDGLHEELKFYQGLQGVYESVVHAPPWIEPRRLRGICDRGLIRVFEQTSHVIEGKHRLPKHSGHIFVFNHLTIHPYNVLPNGFRPLLDSQFVGALLLYRHYGNSALQIVPAADASEHGHQFYYERLGHLLEKRGEGITGEKERGFERILPSRPLEEARRCLLQGQNLVMSLEEASRPTQDSPGRCGALAFELALSIKPQPLIVPVALANFDGRPKSSTFAAVIKEPFRVCELVDATDNGALTQFLEDYRRVFAGYVAEAMALAGQTRLAPPMHVDSYAQCGAA